MPGIFKKSKKEKVPETVPLRPQGAQPDFEIVYSLLSDVGCVREVNEDCGKIVKPDDPVTLEARGVLCVVADGMGGHSAGEVASRLAVDCISQAYYDNRGDAQKALKKAFQEANRRIFEASQKGEELRGMGTTSTALVLQNGSAIAAHVGDSRLYLVRDSEIYLMTEDHSAVMEMVKRGWISLEQARHHPDKNVILRAMGSHEEVDVTIWEEPFPIRKGDKFLLCSDGLYDLVEDEEIKQALLYGDPKYACETLVALAKERGGHDNITVGIVSLTPADDGASGETPSTRETSQVPPTRELEVRK